MGGVERYRGADDEGERMSDAEQGPLSVDWCSGQVAAWVAGWVTAELQLAVPSDQLLISRSGQLQAADLEHSAMLEKCQPASERCGT